MFNSHEYRYIQYLILAGIIAGAIAIRFVSSDFRVLFDSDPWWFYRHAQEIYSNNFQPPRWDMLSHYPPGRPVDYPLGWSYTLAVFYAVIQPFFQNITLMKFSGLFVPVFASLSAVPAYFIVRMITNSWGGLASALLVVTSPAFLTESFAGYPDTDSIVVIYTFLAVLTTIYTIKKADKIDSVDMMTFFKSLGKYLPYLIPAILVYWLFNTNWQFAFYIYFIFLSFTPFLILFRFLEGKIFYRQKGYFPLLYEKIVQSKGTIISMISLGLLSELFSTLTNHWPYNTMPTHQQILSALNFGNGLIMATTILAVIFISIAFIIGLSSGKARGLPIRIRNGIIVGIYLLLLTATVIIIASFMTMPNSLGESSIANQFVSELKPINIFSEISTVVIRIGLPQIILGLFGISAIILFKLFSKREVSTSEYFGLVWVMATFLLVGFGERFTLLLSVATATTAGIVIGNLIEFSKIRRNYVTHAIYIIIIVGLLTQPLYVMQHVNAAYRSAYISDNWVKALDWLKNNAAKDSLVATWWDSGHMIAGYTGLRVHTDGAHCTGCEPYDFDRRLVDMGRILSTSSESESIATLQKYTKLPIEECEHVRAHFGSATAAEACAPISEVYVVVSADMIEKYHVISYFGSFNYTSKSGTSTTYVVSGFTGKDENGNLIYGNNIIGNGVIIIERKNNQTIPLVDLPEEGIKRKVIKQMVSYDKHGNETMLDFSNTSGNVVDGLLWLDPEGKLAIFMNPEIKDSIFNILFFFNGKELHHFNQVYQNIEVKIYRVLF